VKSFKEVEATRIAYHHDGAVNSVHRSSLLVPELEGARAEVSFLNHFLLKRGYQDVGCRVTAVGPDGRRVESRLLAIDEPRVYTLALSGTFDADVSGYLIEFFTGQNLFIPFPAVMVNHVGDNYLNTVHAYNRVLNDVFEDDAINGSMVEEASIDIALQENTDTFVVFTAGAQGCQGKVQLGLSGQSGTKRADVDLNIARFGSREISVKECFSTADDGDVVLTVTQPPQFMFYGRMLCGRRTSDGRISANHSYYDTSTSDEYWDDGAPSYRLYPFLAGITNTVRMYPIMARGALFITVQLFDVDGIGLPPLRAGILESPGAEFVEVDVNRQLSESGVDPQRIGAFAVSATPVDGCTPTRVNHQLIHGDAPLFSSVNVSLINGNVFQSPGKTGFAWGQIPMGADLSTWLGIVGNRPDGSACELNITFYDESGLIRQHHASMPSGGSVRFDPATLAELTEVAGHEGARRNVWFTVQSTRPDLSGFAAIRHDAGGGFSGEHTF
jgi:hypothetical protein